MFRFVSLIPRQEETLERTFSTRKSPYPCKCTNLSAASLAPRTTPSTLSVPKSSSVASHSTRSASTLGLASRQRIPFGTFSQSERMTVEASEEAEEQEMRSRVGKKWERKERREARVVEAREGLEGRVCGGAVSWVRCEEERAHVDNADYPTCCADSSTGQATQSRLSLFRDFLLRGDADYNKVCGGGGVEDGKERGRGGGGREEEETKGLVVELDDAGRQRVSSQLPDEPHEERQLTLPSEQLPLPHTPPQPL